VTFNPDEARQNHGKFGTKDDVLKGPPDASATAQQQPSASAIVTERPINPAAHAGAESPEAATLQAQKVAGDYKPLPGLPQKPIALAGQFYVPGPIGRLKDAAANYMAGTGREYQPPTEYVKVDKDRAARIAAEYDKMANAPDDPKVKASYAAMIKETLAQWDAIKQTGLKVEWVKPGQKDPYAESPRLAAMDVSMNNHWWGFPTDLGYGSEPGKSNTNAAENPLLRPTGEIIDGRPVVANDVFRIVHDMMGHLKEGNGFRADGEENAWRSHASMYSPEALPAMTAETRGQNSWVNFGPHGATNRTADAEHTIFAPQKIGLMPDWTHDEGRT
jgi:hypothetical protein